MRALKGSLDAIATVLLLVAAGVFLWNSALGPRLPPEGMRPQPSVEDVNGLVSLSNVVSSYIVGAQEARLVVVEFSDFECPFCARHAKETYPSIEREWIEPGAVKYVFRHFPLQRNHQSALAAAKAAHCSAAQGRFWEARTALFDGQAEFGRNPWQDILSSAGIDSRLHAHCFESTPDAVILSDYDEGERLGVNSTPTFFVGVEQDDGSVRLFAKIRGAQPYDLFKTTLERAISRSPTEDPK